MKFSTIFYQSYFTSSDNGWRVFTAKDFNGNMGHQGPSFATEKEAKEFCKSQQFAE